MNTTKITPAKRTDQKIPRDMLNPNPDNENFSSPQTIFLHPEFKSEVRGVIDFVPKATYVHSDSLMAQNDTKYDVAIDIEKICRTVRDNTPQFFEIFLQVLLDKPSLRLVHMTAGLDSRTGKSYRVYGFVEQ